LSLGIYIHIPFCHRRCNYCDFYLTTNTKLVDNFVGSLIKEIKLFSSDKRLKADTIYIGGGTPSILDKPQIERIFECLYCSFDVAANSEITVECNPEDVLKGSNKLIDFRNIGINRISLGVQSFIDNELNFLSRQHNSKQAYDSVLAAIDIFRNISIDLIYDLPKQDFASVEYNISLISELDIPHVSAYTLITEKGTLLYKHLLNSGCTRDEISNEKLYYLFTDNMKHLGYTHYEISNYSQKGFESRHNLKYWMFDEYVGFGPSAHSFHDRTRWNNYPNIRKYNDSLESGISPKENIEELSLQTMEEDYFICTLRSRGINKAQYMNLFGKNFDEAFGNVANSLIDMKLGENTSDCFTLTEKGYAIADEITFGFIKSIKNQNEF